MTKITKISKIQNYRNFKDFSWPSGLEEFKDRNLIYGANSSGKTTISTIFQSIQQVFQSPNSSFDQENQKITLGNFELSVTGTSERQIELRNKSKLGQVVKLETNEKFDINSLPKIRVYNQDFIDKNVGIPTSINKNYPDSEDKFIIKGVFQIGETSIEVGKELVRKDEEIKVVDERLIDLRERTKNEEGALEESSTEAARHIKKLVGYGLYTKANLKPRIKEFENLSNAEREQWQISNKKKESLIIEKDETIKPSIEIESKNLCEDVARAVESSIEVLIREVNLPSSSKLKWGENDDDEIKKWVSDGFSLHTKGRDGHHREDCAYCKQRVPNERIKVLKEHFNKETTRLLLNVGECQEKIKNTIKRVSEHGYRRNAEIFEKILTDMRYDTKKEAHSELKRKLLGSLQEIEKFLEDRAVNIHESIIENNGEQMVSWRHNVQEFSTVFEDLQTVYKQHNEMRTTNEDNQKFAKEILEKGEVFNYYNSRERSLLLERIRHAAEMQRTSELTRVQLLTEREGILAKMQRVRDPRISMETMNKDLKEYLGHQEIQFEEVLNSAGEFLGYRLTRKGVLATNLSEGEKTAIALIYFLATLADVSFDGIEQGIVVIDDPMSSLDFQNFSSAMRFIKNKVKNAGQLFLLTHNTDAMNEFRRWYTRSKPKRKSSHYLLQQSCVHLNEDGTRKSPTLKGLDALIAENETDYHHLYHCVYYAINKSDKVVTSCSVVPMARKVLDNFIDHDFPGFSLNPLLQELGKIDSRLPDEYVGLRDYLNHNVHDVAPNLKTSTPEECMRALMDTLEIIKRINRRHGENMEKLVENRPNPF